MTTHRGKEAPVIWALRVLSWAALILLLALAVAVTVVPRVLGGTTYTILTGSMKPQLNPGDLVAVRSANFSDVGVGDVIVYQVESGKPAVITHRVVGIGQDGEGNRVLRTQGDANAEVDEQSVRSEQLRGTVMYSLPHLGFLTGQLSQSTKSGALIVVAVGLILYGIGSLIWPREKAVASEPT